MGVVFERGSIPGEETALMNLYITSDHVGIETGGGRVTSEEISAFRHLGESVGIHRTVIDSRIGIGEDRTVWTDDATAMSLVQSLQSRSTFAHFYAGTFSDTIHFLKHHHRTRITYTAAAHSIEESRKEHETLGLDFPYPHLTDPSLWRRYVSGYLAANVLIVPSRHSRDVMRQHGATGRIEVVPHGVDLPEQVQPLSGKFTVGYLGAVGPDKGLIYLLQAWKKLPFKRDAVLVIAGRDSQSLFVQEMILRMFNGVFSERILGTQKISIRTEQGDIILAGWQHNVSDFYNSIHCYVQPSVSEGFGIEVLEAMAHGRPVICSIGAGASDCVPEGWKFLPRDVDELAAKIDCVRTILSNPVPEFLAQWRNRASHYTWDKIRNLYLNVWRSLL